MGIRRNSEFDQLFGPLKTQFSLPIFPLGPICQRRLRQPFFPFPPFSSSTLTYLSSSSTFLSPQLFFNFSSFFPPFPPLLPHHRSLSTSLPFHRILTIVFSHLHYIPLPSLPPLLLIYLLFPYPFTIIPLPLFSTSKSAPPISLVSFHSFLSFFLPPSHHTVILTL